MNTTTDTKSAASANGVGCGALLGVLRSLAKEMRDCEAQCIHAPNVKALYASRAAEIEAALSPLDRLVEASKGLREVVEGVRSERWVADGRRLKDTREWCAFYSALANFKLSSPNQ